MEIKLNEFVFLGKSTRDCKEAKSIERFLPTTSCLYYGDQVT